MAEGVKQAACCVWAPWSGLWLECGGLHRCLRSRLGAGGQGHGCPVMQLGPGGCGPLLKDLK